MSEKNTNKVDATSLGNQADAIWLLKEELEKCGYDNLSELLAGGANLLFYIWVRLISREPVLLEPIVTRRTGTEETGVTWQDARADIEKLVAHIVEVTDTYVKDKE